MTEEGARPCRSQATHPSPPQGAAQELGILSSSWPPSLPCCPLGLGREHPQGPAQSPPPCSLPQGHTMAQLIAP